MNVHYTHISRPEQSLKELEKILHQKHWVNINRLLREQSRDGHAQFIMATHIYPYSCAAPALRSSLSKATGSAEWRMKIQTIISFTKIFS